MKAKRNSELAYFNRMTTTLVLQLEHESDYQTCLNLYEERRDMYFQLSSDTGHSLYQSEYLGDNTDIIDTFLTTLLGTEGDFTFSPSSLERQLLQQAERSLYHRSVKRKNIIV